MIKIASWNTEGRLTSYVTGDRGSPNCILDNIEKINADVMVLPEAFIDKVEDGVDGQLKEMGYYWHDVAYKDHGRDYNNEFVPGMVYMRVLSKSEMLNVEEKRWGEIRDCLVFKIVDPES